VSAAAPGLAPAAPAAGDDESPIRAANEPAIKAALKLFGGTITAITPPPVKHVPETVDDENIDDDIPPPDDTAFDEPPND
jgi:hypothetical protein